MSEQLEQQIKKIFSDQLGVPINHIGNHTLMNSLGADSLDQIEMIMSIEEQFNCEIKDDIAENLQTVQSVINYLNKLSKNGPVKT